MNWLLLPLGIVGFILLVLPVSTIERAFKKISRKSKRP